MFCHLVSSEKLLATKGILKHVDVILGLVLARATSLTTWHSDYSISLCRVFPQVLCLLQSSKHGCFAGSFAEPRLHPSTKYPFWCFRDLLAEPATTLAYRIFVWRVAEKNVSSWHWHSFAKLHVAPAAGSSLSFPALCKPSLASFSPPISFSAIVILFASNYLISSPRLM